MTPIREDKPAWSSVPASVKASSEAILGARVVRAVRAFGGYGPSATFALSLDDGRRAFFKGVYPLPEGSAVKWSLDDEERVYTTLHDFIRPWAPEYYGSIRSDGWHALLIEAVDGEKVPPWTAPLAERAVRSFAEFHATTVGRALPEWLPRSHHLEFAGFWGEITSSPDVADRVVRMCADETAAADARAWLRHNGQSLVAAEEALETASPDKFALLHFDTRSDNIRVGRETLRIFDWPFACAGPPEFDLGAFAQSMTSEGGPNPELLAEQYAGVLSVDENLLTASVVGLAGYFAERGSRPDLPGLPRLRAVQRRQLNSSLAWAARRLDLPPPDWVNTLAD
jgi:hypothetical protein